MFHASPHQFCSQAGKACRQGRQVRRQVPLHVPTSGLPEGYHNCCLPSFTVQDVHNAMGHVGLG